MAYNDIQRARARTSFARGATLRIGVAVAAITIAPAAEAQSRGTMLVNELKYAAGDAWAVWTSPFRARSSDWLGAAAVIGVGAAVSPFDDEVDRWAVRNRTAGVLDIVKPFREGGFAYSGRTVTPVALGLVGIALIAGSETMLDGIFGCATAYGASSLARSYVAYRLIGRSRPDAARDPNTPPASSGDQYDFSIPGKSDWGQHSFPGGHVANAAACASFLTSRYDLGAASALPWAVVGAVGIARTLDRRHWLSDDVVGALFGYAVGREVALRSARRAAKAADDESPRGGVSGPFVSPTPYGLRIGWRGVFQ